MYDAHLHGFRMLNTTSRTNVLMFMQAPNAEMPPTSVPEREEILKPMLAGALENHLAAQAATKKGKKGKKGGEKKKK